MSEKQSVPFAPVDRYNTTSDKREMKAPSSEKRDTDQRAPTQAGERATLAADQVQANAPESDALPERRTQQVAYPGIDKRKVRGETPKVDAEIEHPQNILIENAQAERKGETVSYQVVRANFARELEREAAFYKLAATMQRENQEHAEAELNGALRELAEANTRLENNFAFNTDGERIVCKPGEIPDGIECRDATIAGQDKIIEELRAKLSDAKTVVAGLAQVSEMAHKENAELTRRLDEALDVIERHEAEKEADVLAEREACAKVCDARSDEHWKSYKTIGPFRGDSRAETWGDEAEECAKAIRARTGGKP